MSAGNTSDQGWPVIDLQPDLQVRLTRRTPNLPANVETIVASIWEQEIRERPRLFNGVVFSADTVTAGCIEGHWTEYRRVLAQMRVNDLFATLGIRALAVNGLLECAEGVVLGRREPNSVYQPGGWQSPPAGSVERRSGSPDDSNLDLAGQVLAECEEELGIQAGDVMVLKPVVAIEHPGSHVVDIGLLLRTSLTFAEVETTWRRNGNCEYDQLRLLIPASLQPDTRQPLEMLPTTRALVAAWLRDRPPA